MTILTCNRCKQDKEISCFSNERRNVSNFGKRYQCKSCDSVMNKTWRENLSEDGKKKLYANNRKYYEGTLKGRVILLFNGILQRCKKSGHAVEIDANYIQSKLENGVCEATGFTFQYAKSEKGGITPFSPSVDRINSKDGYTEQNIQMVCSIYNIGKSHHDETDFIAMCMAVAERNATNNKAKQRLEELRNATKC